MPFPHSHIPTEEQNAALNLLERGLSSDAEFSRLVCLTGPYGTGKTHLATILRDRLERSGVQVVGLTARPDAAAMVSDLDAAIANSSSSKPLVVMIDEWDQLKGTRGTSRDLARIQRLIRDVMCRDSKSGVVLISASPDATDLLPPALVMRSVMARLSTGWRLINRTLSASPGVAPIVNAGIPEQLRAYVENRAASGHFHVMQALGDAPSRQFLATHLLHFIAGRELQGFALASDVLQRAQVLRRMDNDWVVADWLQLILEEAGIRPAAYALNGEDAVRRISTSLEALGWERYLRHLINVFGWLESEITATGLELPLADGALPILVARSGQTPRQFVASLFRPSDLARLARSGEKQTKETLLDEAYRNWQETAQ